jgi:hypothetical protein
MKLYSNLKKPFTEFTDCSTFYNETTVIIIAANILLCKEIFIQVM